VNARHTCLVVVCSLRLILKCIALISHYKMFGRTVKSTKNPFFVCLVILKRCILQLQIVRLMKDRRCLSLLKPTHLIKRLKLVTAAMIRGNIEYVRQYLDDSTESTIFLHGVEAWDIHRPSNDDDIDDDVLMRGMFRLPAAPLCILLLARCTHKCLSFSYNGEPIQMPQMFMAGFLL